MTDFDTFWARYPRRVGKLAALEQWKKAIRLASPEDIIAGVDRYKRTKPEYADWCHPKTFLSQGRWMDEPDEVPASIFAGCHHTPSCENSRSCWLKRKGAA